MCARAVRRRTYVWRKKLWKKVSPRRRQASKKKVRSLEWEQIDGYQYVKESFSFLVKLSPQRARSARRKSKRRRQKQQQEYGQEQQHEQKQVTAATTRTKQKSKCRRKRAKALSLDSSGLFSKRRT